MLKGLKICYSQRKIGCISLCIAGMVLFLAMFADCAFAQGEQVVENVGGRSFFYQFIVAGGPIVWFVLIPMSLFTVYLLVDMCLTIRVSRLVPDSACERIVKLYTKFPAAQLPVRLSESDDLLSRSALRALEKIQNTSSDLQDIHEIGAEALYEQSHPILRRVEWCNIIGNVAPMVGLFGTVYGMIRAFNILGLSGGQPPADQLASAIGVALITTLWGLLIAIPALVMCGIFRSRLEAIMGHAAIELEKVLANISTIEKRNRRMQKKSKTQTLLQTKVEL
jgi:biopolymer transport protein ExbB